MSAKKRTSAFLFAMLIDLGTVLWYIVIIKNYGGIEYEKASDRFTYPCGNAALRLRRLKQYGQQHIVFTGGKLLLGTWQDIYFCEFDGPRTRKFYVKVMGDR